MLYEVITSNRQEKIKRGEIMRTSLKDFKKKALQNPEVKSEYDRLSSAYELRMQLIKIRKDAGLTQEELAELLNTKKSNISRLENVNSNVITSYSIHYTKLYESRGRSVATRLFIHYLVVVIQVKFALFFLIDSPVSCIL